MRKLFYTALLLLLVSIGVTPAVSVTAAPNLSQKGVLMQPQSNTDFSSTTFKQSVDKAVATGVNYITLVIPVHQSNEWSTDVQTGWDTPTDQALADGINYIKSKGINAALTIHANPYNGQWRALINPGDRATWFQKYSGLLNHYATIAQTHGAKEIVIGTELSSMTMPSINASNTGYWINVIQGVRNHFSGLVTYSAQHSGTYGDASSLEFWPYLDTIGLSAYYSVGDSDNVTVDQMKARWDYWNNTIIKNLSTKYGKPIIFTEVGYVSKNGAVIDPGSAYSRPGDVNLTLQANAYKALLEYWSNYSYLQGVHWWDWKTNPNAGGAGDTDYTPQNKPAEQVMKQHFTQTGSVTPPTPTPALQLSTNTQAPATTVNTATNITTTITSNQAIQDAIMDFEIYNQSGQRVHQAFYEHRTIAAGTTTATTAWTPSASGTYTVKLGIFSSNWQANLLWENDAATLQVTTSATPPTPLPPTTPTTPTPPPTTPPTTPSTPTTAVLDIWWPGNGVTVSGVQPFKAHVQGWRNEQYTMYWQVDGGQLNLMQNQTTPVDYKESLVDMSGWRWNTNRIYKITFIARDLQGNTLVQKSIDITVQN